MTPIRAAIVLLLAGLGATSVIMSTFNPTEAALRISPERDTIVVGESFTITIQARAETPVNVFKGELTFDPTVLDVATIDYNNSVADLWAEKPWYDNGAGTLNFIGGTTQPEGFTGDAPLISVTFTTRKPGNAALTLRDIRILKHDGLGSDAVIAEPIDTLFTVHKATTETQAVPTLNHQDARVHVLEEAPSTDLNGDGKQSFADLSIFMSHLASGNPRSDFNRDGHVTAADLSIIMNAD